MYLSIFDNDYFKIVLVFVLSVGFLVLFSFCATFATKYVERKKFRKMDHTDKTSRQARIYELVFSKNEITEEELKEYFNCDMELIREDLQEMCNNNVIKKENDKYIINR